MHLLRNITLITLLAMILSVNATHGRFFYRLTPYGSELTFRKPELGKTAPKPTANDGYEISFSEQTTIDDMTSKPNNNGYRSNAAVCFLNNYALFILFQIIFISHRHIQK